MSDRSNNQPYEVTLTEKWFGRLHTLTAGGAQPLLAQALIDEGCQDLRQITLYIPTGSTLEVSNRLLGTYLAITEKVFVVPCASDPLGQCWVRGSGPLQVYAHGFSIPPQKG